METVHKLDSDPILWLLGIFENYKNGIAILLSVKNDAYSRIFGDKACSRAEISFYKILKLAFGPTSLKNVTSLDSK